MSKQQVSIFMGGTGANTASDARTNLGVVAVSGDTMTGNLNVAATLITQNVIPNANITYDLGSSEARFKDLWLSNSTIYLGEASISAQGGNVSFGNAEIQLSNVSTKLNVTNDLFVGGNVGIGTTSPAYALDVGDSAGGNMLRMTRSTTEMGGFISGGTPFFGAISNNDFALMTNSSDRARITADGNVGIGTTTPDGALHVKSSTNKTIKLDATLADGTSSWTALSIARNGTDKFRIFQYGDDRGLLVYSDAGSTNSIFLANTGSVGIGTTAPSTKLHLYESGAADAIFRITPQNVSYDPVIQMVGQDNNIAVEGFEIWYDNSVGDVHLGTTFDDAAASIRFHTRTGASKSTSNERLTILGNGYVGISTSNPQQPFVLVDGTGRGIEMGPSQGVGSGAFLQAFTRGSNVYNQFTYYATAHTWYAGSGGSSGSISRIIDLTSSGLGIGTSSPGSRVTLGPSFATIIGLTIDTESSQDSAFVARKSANKPAFGLLPWDGQVYLSAGIYYDSGSWIQHCDTNDNLLFVLDPGGGVRWYASDNGSGSWNVVTDLQLWNPAGQWTAAVNTSTAKVIAGNGWQYGNLQLTGLLSGYGDNEYPTLKTSGGTIHFDAQGTYTGYITFNGGFTDVSDERQKKNIRSINNALDILTNLRGVRFNWKDDRDDGLDHAGFIAQEVQQYLPEAVSASGPGLLGVHSPSIVAVLVQAVKEQQVLIENMQAEINALKGSQ